MIEDSLTDLVLPIEDFVRKSDDADFNRSIRKIKSECSVKTSLLYQIAKLCTEK